MKIETSYSQTTKKWGYTLYDRSGEPISQNVKYNSQEEAYRAGVQDKINTIKGRFL